MTNSNFLRRWGHYAPYLICVILLIVIASVEITLPINVVLGVGVLFVGLLLVSWRAMRRHDKYLCEYCIKAMPLNAEKAAKRNKFFLDLAHKPTNMILSYLGLLILVDFMMISWSNNWMYVVWITAYTPMFAFMYAHTAHFRLQAWCPICRERGIEKHSEGKVMA